VMAASVPWHDDVVQGPVQLVDGHWCLPEAPGLGIELNEREAAKHPFQQEVLASIHARIDDGTIVDW
jgi:galactonate dehydratase